jgi:lipoate-protein ligase A
MLLLDATLDSLEESLALDEALLLDAEQGGPEVLRLWEWPSPAVVLGAGCRLADDVDEAACREGGVPILRRGSGGGTVLLGEGCLLYSLILSHDRAEELQHVRPSYAWILRRMIEALTPLGIDLKQAGTSDLVLDGRKVSGNSQHRKRSHLLHHGTLLCGFNLADVARYLRVPARQPDYRGGRGHQAFLGNLQASPQEVRTLVSRAWQASEPLCERLADQVSRLVREKYGHEDWIGRR